MKMSKKYNNLFRGVVISALALMLAAPAVSMAASTGADKLIVKDASGNQKFSAKDDGSVMLNTATFDGPSYAYVYGASDGGIAGLAFDSYAASATAGGGGAFRFARGTQAAKTVVQNGDRLGFFVFGAYDGTAFYNSAALTAKIDGAASTGIVPTKLVFETTATTTRAERMAISSSGYVGIGLTSTTAPSHPLHMVDSGAYVTTGGVWTNASSREYKEDIKGLTTTEALETLEGLNPVKYAYKTDKDERHIGFIAEDVPALVATKDRKGLSAMDIVAVLTKVVQDQKNMISELSGKVDAMQQEINKVKGNNMIGSLGTATITE